MSTLSASAAADRPSWLRLIAAFLLAALVPTVLYAGLIAQEQMANIHARTANQTDLAYWLNYAHTFAGRTMRWVMIGIVLGGVIPAIATAGFLYAFLRKRLPIRLWIAMATGGVAANTQSVLFELWGVLSGGRGGLVAYTQGSRQIIRDGHRTFDGWIAFMEGAAVTFALGAIGGVVFWWIVRPRSAAM